MPIHSTPRNEHHSLRIHPALDRHLGHWITSRGRRMQTDEMMRLQGMDPNKLVIPSCLSEADVGRLVGNSMPVNVLSRILALALPAANLWGQIQDPVDGVKRRRVQA